MMQRELKELGKDQRGAVLVEFLVALMPLMITFFTFVQLAWVATARVVVKHSAVVGARAAAVISNVNGNTPDQPDQGFGNKSEIDMAVWLAMGDWFHPMHDVTVAVDDASSCDDPFGPVTVTVTADYTCQVPFGKIICLGRHVRLTDNYTMPHQGARFLEGGGSKCGVESPPGGPYGAGDDHDEGAEFKGGGGEFGGGGASGKF